MRGNRPVTIWLDCPFTSWSAQERLARMVRQDLAREPRVLPFTFNHAPSTLDLDDRHIVLRPQGGVKS